MQTCDQKTYLKPLSLDHAEVYAKWTNDPMVNKYTAFHRFTLEQKTEWIKEKLKSDKEEVLSVFVGENNKLIGTVGIHGLDNKDGVYLLWIVIGEKEYWGNGYGHDAFSALINHAFSQRKAKKLVLDVRVENEVAIKMYQRCGFKITKKIKKFSERDRVEYDYYYMELMEL